MACSPLSTKSVPEDNDGNKEDGCSSHFHKTVCLQDWWLIKADKEFEGKRLAVAGLTSRAKQQVRVFYSAPIARRFDVFTLETADGICVVIQGFMNKLRTIENGFSSEVSSHFLFGFPMHWEEYAKKFFREESSKGIGLGNISNAEKATTKPDGKLEGSEQQTESMVQSIIDATPNAVEVDAVNFTPANSNSKRSVFKSEDLRRKQREKPVSRCSMKDEGKRYIREVADGKRPKGNSSQSAACSGVEIEASEATPSHSVRKMSRNLLGIPNSKDGKLEGTEQPAASMVQSRIDATPNAVAVDAVNFTPANSNSKRSVFKSEYLRRKQREKPASRCSMKDKGKRYMREVADGKKPKGNSSQSAVSSGVEIEASEAKPSHSARKMSRNLLGIPKSKGKKQHSSTYKSKRKIIFDSHVSPLIQEREVCIVSPESLSSRRSRSGRLIVQPLHFWRNQIPIYDADRNMIGIQEEMHAV